MTPEMVLDHISAGQGMKARGSLYIMSHENYMKLERALEEHLASGALVPDLYGLRLATDAPHEPL